MLWPLVINKGRMGSHAWSVLSHHLKKSSSVWGRLESGKIISSLELNLKSWQLTSAIVTWVGKTCQPRCPAAVGD